MKRISAVFRWTVRGTHGIHGKVKSSPVLFGAIQVKSFFRPHFSAILLSARIRVIRGSFSFIRVIRPIFFPSELERTIGPQKELDPKSGSFSFVFFVHFVAELLRV
jgi:hypothetical protein